MLVVTSVHSYISTQLQCNRNAITCQLCTQALSNGTNSLMRAHENNANNKVQLHPMTVWWRYFSGVFLWRLLYVLRDALFPSNSPFNQLTVLSELSEKYNNSVAITIFQHKCAISPSRISPNRFISNRSVFFLFFIAIGAKRRALRPSMQRKTM